MPDITAKIKKFNADKKIFVSGESISNIGMLIQGQVKISDSYTSITAKKGEILGICDLFEGKYTADYIAESASTVYMFPVVSEETLETFLDSNEDYRGIFVYSLILNFNRYYKSRKKLLIMLDEARKHVRDHYAYLKRAGVNIKNAPNISDLSAREEYDLSEDPEDAEYYEECAGNSVEVYQTFFKQSTYMTTYICKKVRMATEEMRQDMQVICENLKNMYGYLYDPNTKEGLLSKEKEILEMQYEKSSMDQGLVNRLNETKDEVITIMSVLEKVGLSCEGADAEKVENEVKDIIEAAARIQTSGEGEAAAGSDEEDDNINLTEALLNSLQSILYFSGIEKEDAEEFTKYANSFESLSDRMSTDDDVRKLKKKITSIYFDIYEGCVYKWIKNKEVPLPVLLFIYFGYMDERLLTFDQLKALYSVSKKIGEVGETGVYYMPEWLEAVYTGEREPSRNTFEQDYPDWLREQKKRGEISAEEAESLKDDRYEMFHFEIENLCTQACKVCNGQILTYVPMLYQEEIYASIAESFMGRRTINDLLYKIEDVDISAFAREITYYDKENEDIEKEQIISTIYPDVILAPVYGMSATMWQEIGSKRRSTPGRIVFPVFEESDSEKLMVQMVGRLHWEYVRREMGVDWNNIGVRSLTSEYSDYLQYYRKNRDLSEELREKVKIQLQKARNNFRDAFVIDYVNWIKYEATGAMKLNRVAREIMATYCPFAKEIRDRLRSNAMFEKAMFRQEREFGEKKHTWELKIRKFESHDVEVPEEFYDTLEYYSES